MKVRWMLAAVGALALAGVTVPFALRSMQERDTVQAAAAAGVCEANPKPTNLDFTIKDMDGKDHQLAGYKGKVILLDFWATWCGPCKVEIPGFVDLYTRYKDKGLVVLGLSVDDPLEKLKPFATEYKMNYPVLVGLGRDDVQDSFGPVWGIPTTFLIGRDGKMCKKHIGLATKEQFEKEIKALLEL